MVEKVNLRDYLSLYERGMSLDRIKPLKNQTYRIFSKVNERFKRDGWLDIRIVHRKKTYENPQAFKKIVHFVQDNEYFYMIPVTTIKGTIVGFILRGVTRSDYSTISREFEDSQKRVPLMYGFDYRFKDFDKHNTCYPIIVCEGSKDCMIMKQLYPYSVALNTSSMGINAQVLINISNKFVLAYDNDKAGQEGIERDKKILRRLGAQVVSLELDKNFKDISDYYGHPDKIKNLKEEIKYKLRRVNSF